MSQVNTPESGSTPTSEMKAQPLKSLRSELETGNCLAILRRLDKRLQSIPPPGKKPLKPLKGRIRVGTFSGLDEHIKECQSPEALCQMADKIAQIMADGFQYHRNVLTVRLCAIFQKKIKQEELSNSSQSTLKIEKLGKRTVLMLPINFDEVLGDAKTLNELLSIKKILVNDYDAAKKLDHTQKEYTEPLLKWIAQTDKKIQAVQDLNQLSLIADPHSLENFLVPLEACIEKIVPLPLKVKSEKSGDKKPANAATVVEARLEIVRVKIAELLEWEKSQQDPYVATHQIDDAIKALESLIEEWRQKIPIKQTADALRWLRESRLHLKRAKALADDACSMQKKK